MDVKVIKSFEIPGKPKFVEGKVYTLDEKLANLLISRGLVEPVKAAKKEEKKEETTKKKI